MRYTVDYTSLVADAYITLNIGDVVVGIDINASPDKIVIFRIDKTGRNL